MCFLAKLTLTVGPNFGMKTKSVTFITIEWNLWEAKRCMGAKVQDEKMLRFAS